MFLLGFGNFEYLSCSTKFNKNYDLVSITHNIRFDNSSLSISLC